MFGIAVFILSAAALLSIAGLSLFAFLRRGFECWPPPSADQWQHRSLAHRDNDRPDTKLPCVCH